MSTDLDKLVADASGNLQATPLSRKQVIPYADLDALNQPAELNQLTNNLVPTISVLSAQGPDTGKLLRASDVGALYSAASTNFNAHVASHANVGDKSFLVDDPSWPEQAGWFWIVQSPAHGSLEQGPFFAFTGSDPHEVVIGVPLGLTLDPGDVVFSVPQVGLFGSLNAVDVVDRAARLLGRVTVDDLAPTVNFGASFANPNTPGFTIPAVSGLAVHLLYFCVIINNVSGATAYSTNITLASTGTGAVNLWFGHAGTPNVNGSTDYMPKSPFQVITQPGQGLSIACGVAVPAGYGVDIDAGYRYV